MAFDHGILNVPQAKRGGGCIDAQIDRFKAEQAAQKRAAAEARAQETKADRATAKALLAEVTDATVERIAEKSGQSIALTRRRLAQMAHWEPKLVIAALAA